MNLADYKNIWVFIETECGSQKNVGFELNQQQQNHLHRKKAVN